jgi:pseudouridine-5'-phosphate glycosidase/pseudouridine kinase
VKVNLCSVIGDDIAGATVLSAITTSGLSTTHIRREDAESGARTAQYVAVNDSQKSLVLGMADMDILTSRPFSQTYWSRAITDAEPKYLVVDANWSPSAIRSFLALAGDAVTVFEPVSAAKSQRLFTGDKLGVFPRHEVSMAAPNIHELLAMDEAADREGYFEHGPWYEAVDRMNIRDAAVVDYEVRLYDILEAGVREKMLRLLPYIPTIVAKLGDQGVLLAEIMRPHDWRLTAPEHQQYILARRTVSNPDAMIGGVYMRLYPAVERVSDVVSVNGVGDTFLGALVAVLARGGTVHEYVDLAQKAAVMTLRSKEAVSPGLEELKTGLP